MSRTHFIRLTLLLSLLLAPSTLLRAVEPTNAAELAAKKAAEEKTVNEKYANWKATLPADQQASYLAGLETQAKEIVEPKITQDRTRLKEDLTYALEKREQEKRDLQATFDKITGQMDFNKNREIAQSNTAAAKAMQNVGNLAFVTGIAGSGIFSRRSFYVRESLQNAVDDTNINFDQQRSQMALKKGQAENAIDDEISRLYQLNDRDLSDLDQTQKEDELSVFLELAGNKFGQKGTQNAALLEAGANSDFAKGGTDAERQTRYQTKDRYLKMSTDDIAKEKVGADLDMLRKIQAYGSPTGTVYGYMSFPGYTGEQALSLAISEDWYNSDLRPKLRRLQEIDNGSFQDGIRSELGLKK